MLELRGRWQQELATQAGLEEQRYLSGQAFDFEPIAYPWCAHYTQISETEAASDPDPIIGRRKLYVLCVTQNTNGDCTAFAARGPA
jgi:hypothetical protein